MVAFTARTLNLNSDVTKMTEKITYAKGNERAISILQNVIKEMGMRTTQKQILVLCSIDL